LQLKDETLDERVGVPRRQKTGVVSRDPGNQQTHGDTTWRQIAVNLGNGSPVFYSAALLGHPASTAEEAKKPGAHFKLDGIAARILTEIPENRGGASFRPADLAALRDRPRLRADAEGPNQQRGRDGMSAN
jgi:cyanate lyase